eukprot:jgi/Mesen1/10619/ME000089S10077
MASVAACTSTCATLFSAATSAVVTSKSSQLNKAFLGQAVTANKPFSIKASKRLAVRAADSAKSYQVIEPLNGDPFIGSFETPVTSSPLVSWYLSNLPAYRTAVNPLLRGVEIGLAHGFLLVGPFVKLGPLRDTAIHGESGALAAAGLVAILTVCLTIYGISTFKEKASPIGPALTLSGRKKEQDKLQTADGWAGFSGGFFFGGLSGVAWAYILLYVIDLPYFFK